MELPVAFEQKMKEMLGPDYENYLASFECDAYQGLRVNTAKISVEDFIKLSPYGTGGYGAGFMCSSWREVYGAGGKA